VRTVTLPSYAPNPYEDSLCQETNSPSKRFFAFFSAFQGLAQAAVGLVFWLDFCVLVPTRQGCTKHLGTL